jgi:hypothetical protein
MKGSSGASQSCTSFLRGSPSANKDDCQHTIIEGFGGVSKTQIALRPPIGSATSTPTATSSGFWTVDVTTFKNAYRDVGQLFKAQGIEEDKADVMALVKAALNREITGS